MTRTTIRSTLLSWVVLRVLIGGASHRPTLTLSASMLLILGVATIAVIDVSVARERLFLGNLGVSRRVIAGVSLATACVLELTAALALSAFVPGTS